MKKKLTAICPNASSSKKGIATHLAAHGEGFDRVDAVVAFRLQ